MRGSVRAAIAVGVSVAATLAAAVAWGGSAQIGSAAAFRLVFDGHHTEALLHEGTFTSSSPLCSSGQAADASINEQTLSAVRIFTCAEGGTFSARISPLPAEHTGTGTWQVVAGTGPLADLRGKGTFIGTATSGDPHDPRGLTFRSTWTGVVDLDATPPRLGVLGAKVLKLSSPRNTRLLRLTLSVSDAEHNVVSYLLTVDDRRVPPNTLAARSGRTTGGSLAFALRLHPRAGTRFLRIEVAAEDAVGNRSSLRKVIRVAA